MTLPTLTVCICTYKRPHYGTLTINALKQWLGYDGPRRFHIADGGSPQEHIDYYLKILDGYEVSVEVTDNLSDMVNSCARHGGDYWFVALDDFCPRYPFDITPDVKFLMENEDVGVVRMSRLAFWGSGSGGAETSADLRGSNGRNHWWVLSKERSRDGYMCNIGAHLYHRRFWDAYGDILSCDPNAPGQGELNGAARFNGHPGPTVAIPMRFGQDCSFHQEPFWHLGTWRTDEYAQVAGSRL
jgi:hypothetical protein